MVPTAPVDPRHLVTPDAFSVSDKVLGLPLATGRRRLVAFLIDGVLVAVLAGLGWNILGILAAFFFFRMATKRAPKAKTEAGVAAKAAMGVGVGFRYSIGCLGALILLVVFIGGSGLVQTILSGDDAVSEAIATGSDLVGVVLGSEALPNASSEEEAEAAAVEIGSAMLRLDSAATVQGVLESLEDNLPDLVADREAFLRRVEARIREEMPTELVAANPPTEDTLSLEEALAVYEENLAEPDSSQDEALIDAARTRIADAVAGDQLAERDQTIVGLRDDLERERREAREARETADEAGGVFGWFIGTLDEMGLTFGWGALYFATLLTWFQGRTPGKRVMGLRVIRLDGEPISLYIAFERAGGYAAGLATGLLGFAQLLWDPNRQAIHDKIAGTVVIMDGRERLPGAATPAAR